MMFTLYSKKKLLYLHKEIRLMINTSYHIYAGHF